MGGNRARLFGQLAGNKTGLLKVTIGSGESKVTGCGAIGKGSMLNAKG